jgi:hypothetical protein
MSQNIGALILGLGGTNSTLNVTAASLIKNAPGTLYSLIGNYATAPSAGSLTINDSNALVTAQTITGITVAANAVITLSTGGSTNPFAVNNTITVTGAVGMTQINAVVGTVTAIGGVTTAWTVTTSINSSAFTAWASAGTAASFGVGNQITSLLFSQLAALELACQPLPLNWPCKNGILVSAVPTAGTGIYSIAYT